MITEKLDPRIVRHFFEDEAAFLKQAYRRLIDPQDIAVDLSQVCGLKNVRCRKSDSRGRNSSAPLFLLTYDNAEIAAARLSVNIVIMDQPDSRIILFQTDCQSQTGTCLKKVPV